MRITILATLLASSLAFGQGNALIFDDTSSLGGAGGLQNSAAAAAMALGFTPTTHSNFGTFTTALMGGGWAIVIVTHLNYGGMPSAGDLDALNTYLTGGGTLLFQSWNLVNQGLCAHPLFTTMQVSVACSGLSASNLFVWDPSHGMMMGAASPTVYADVVGFGVDAIAANPVVGQSAAIMGFNTPMPSMNNGAVIVRNDNKAVYMAHFPQMMGPVPAEGARFLEEVLDCMSNPTSCGDSSTCSIAMPLGGAIVMGNVTVNFSANDTQMDPLTAAFEFSSDSGLTWLPATAAPGSPLPNPATGIVTPSPSNTFLWATATDGLGLMVPQPATFRITVDDGVPSSPAGSCTVGVFALNPIPAPNCVLLVPGGGGAAMALGGDIPITVDAGSPAGSPTVTVTLSYSTDSGVTYFPCTMAGSSPNPNPSVGVPTGIRNYVWASQTDMVGVAMAKLVRLRATVDDGGPVQGSCTFDQLVDNSQLCSLCGDCNLNALGPDILDALTAAQIAAGLLVAPAAQRACCDVNTDGTVTVIDALFLAQAAAGLGVVLSCI